MDVRDGVHERDEIRPAVSVRATYSWSAFTPIISSIMGNITASGSTTMSIN